MRAYVLLLFFSITVLSAQSTPPRRFAWRLQNFSALYGLTYYHQFGVAHSFELLFDKSSRQWRRSHYDYYGFGFVGSFHDDFKEIGLKFIITPITRPFRITRRSTILPLAFVQGNLRTVPSMSEANRETGNIRLGAGINADVQLWNAPIVAKPTLTVGYTLADRFTPINRGLTVEFRLGIGIQTWRFR